MTGIKSCSVHNKSHAYSPECHVSLLTSCCRFTSSSGNLNDSSKTPPVSNVTSTTSSTAESAVGTTVDSAPSIGPQGKGGAKASSATDKPTAQTLPKNKASEIVVKGNLDFLHLFLSFLACHN